jgi:hypothetical protein
MKRILSYFFLVLTVVSAVVIVLSIVLLSVMLLGESFGLPKLTSPTYILDYIWWYLVGAIALALASLKLCVMLGDIKRQKSPIKNCP